MSTQKTDKSADRKSKPKYDKEGAGRHGITIIPNTLLMLALQPALTGKDVLYIIGVLAHQYDLDRRSDCSCLRIAKMFGVSEATVTRSARKLNQIGWVPLTDTAGNRIKDGEDCNSRKIWRSAKPLIAELAKLEVPEKKLGRDVHQANETQLAQRIAQLERENAALRAGQPVPVAPATPEAVTVQNTQVEPAPVDPAAEQAELIARAVRSAQALRESCWVSRRQNVSSEIERSFHADSRKAAAQEKLRNLSNEALEEAEKEAGSPTWLAKRLLAEDAPPESSPTDLDSADEEETQVPLAAASDGDDVSYEDDGE